MRCLFGAKRFTNVLSSKGLKMFGAEAIMLQFPHALFRQRKTIHTCLAKARLKWLVEAIMLQFPHALFRQCGTRQGAFGTLVSLSFPFH
jgi:hypothetical protein